MMLEHSNDSRHNIDVESVRILHYNLNLRDVGAKMAPENLFRNLKTNRKEICFDILHRIDEEPYLFERVIMPDVYSDDGCVVAEMLLREEAKMKLTKLLLMKNLNVQQKEKRIIFKLIPLNIVVDCLVNFAPLDLAESWDNVGLIIEPASHIYVEKIILTNDLTEDVIEEAISISANLIISYHPPVFANIKSITSSSWKGRIISECIKNNIAVYSPHTTWDAVKGGINDWLAEGFDYKNIRPIVPREQPISDTKSFVVTIRSDTLSCFNELTHLDASKTFGFSVIRNSDIMSAQNRSIYEYCIHCTSEELNKIIQTIQKFSDVRNFTVIPHKQTRPDFEAGRGRICQLSRSISISEAIDSMKQHLNIDRLHVALARGSTLDTKINTVALCAGAGGSIIRDVNADLKLTGEASHHDVLDSIHRGSSIILSKHSDSERGFLTKFAEILRKKFDAFNVTIIISTKDKDPLVLV